MDIGQLLREHFPGAVGRIRLPGPLVEYDEVTTVEEITPLVAMELIAACWERYQSGRNFYPTKIEKIKRYAEDMLEGRWEYRPDGDPIVLKDGLVCGGRHRLHAILLSGKSIKTNVKRKTTKGAKLNGNPEHTDAHLRPIG
jgi:hypothetical protein